jgi:hypothetical protein
MSPTRTGSGTKMGMILAHLIGAVGAAVIGLGALVGVVL